MERQRTRVALLKALPLILTSCAAALAKETALQVRSVPHISAPTYHRRYLLQTCASGESTWKNNCDNTGGACHKDEQCCCKGSSYTSSSHCNFCCAPGYIGCPDGQCHSKACPSSTSSAAANGDLTMAANLNSASGLSSQDKNPEHALLGPGQNPSGSASTAAKSPPVSGSGTSSTSSSAKTSSSGGSSGSGSSVVAAAAASAGKGILKALEKTVSGSATATPG